ncbi:single-stranded-DNA-specific exonuclease RecJ [Oribacterium sp. WCC10]|uniref:single-stranded-DNA-specific exonuclease RecJ n=1 Tax=Oribacterium sp. WCC10 TaxID=1855343 RepID=UPI0008DFC2FE|nr:single-stranded-DNA-specific exonuclease RecJ [Oribacterium sp. WCC10]SFG31335.1 exonuclease RecJ [Oribacterium sp. WCC10]
MKKWFLYNKKADFKAIADKYGIDQVTARILRNRDINSDSQINQFLHGSLEEDLHSPLYLPDAIKCMNQLNRAIAEKKHIRVVGDYDVDGVCATYILVRGLRRLGAQVDYVLPDRIRDGYGINVDIINKAKEDGVQVILTCDNGIAAIDELKHARELGITVLVTDHHDVRQNQDEDYGCESRDILPPASAVVDPKREDNRYPYPEICGAVVAWKIIIMMYQNHAIPEEEYYEFLEFAAIATICDVMELKDENRTIVKFGLQQLKQTTNPGLRALLQVQELLTQEHITSYHIGYIIGPCINAGGRLRSAEIALDLFLTDDVSEAFDKAVRLKELNDSRKTMTIAATNQAIEMVEKYYMRDMVLVVYIPGLHESLAGIIAGRLRERFYKPSFVITRAEGDEAGEPLVKGSGRSIEGYSMSGHLQEVSDLLLKWGGHPMAAGFTLLERNVESFRAELNRRCTLGKEQLVDKLWIDVPMPIDYISDNLIHDFEKLEPFGKGNEKPCFATKNLGIADCKVFGKNRNVVKMRLLSESGCLMDGLIFTNGDEFLREKGRNAKIDVVYYPQINEYNGNQSLQIIIDDYQLKP